MPMIQIRGGDLYQWDTGRQVEIYPWQNYTADEVHFKNPNGETAYIVEPKIDDGIVVADLPNILLQTTVNIQVFVVMNAEGGERTVADCVFGIIPRQRPSDYVYTETEVKSYNALEERIIALEEGGGSEIPGADGKDGGYYTPTLTQPDENTMRVEFTASTEGMDEIPAQDITLPKGADGDTPTIKVAKLSNRYVIRVTNSGVTETTYFVIPTISVTETADGYTFESTYEGGSFTANVKHGTDYVLTAEDKAEIAEMAMALIPVYEGEVQDIE